MYQHNHALGRRLHAVSQLWRSSGTSLQIGPSARLWKARTTQRNEPLPGPDAGPSQAVSLPGQAQPTRVGCRHLRRRPTESRIGIRVNQREMLDRVVDLLPPGWKPLSSPRVDELHSFLVGGATRTRARAFNLVYWGIARRARTLDLDAGLRDARSQPAAVRRLGGHAPGVRARRCRGVAWPGSRPSRPESRRQEHARGRPDAGGGDLLLGRVRRSRRPRPRAPLRQAAARSATSRVGDRDR